MFEKFGRARHDLGSTGILQMTNPASSRVKPDSVPGNLEWLSDRQTDDGLQPDGDPLPGYCRQLEARIAAQSAEIEALRQMLQSEHDRHARVPPPMRTRAAARLRQTWIGLTMRGQVGDCSIQLSAPGATALERPKNKT